MKETGIIMTADSVCSILSGLKTQTRQVCKKQPVDITTGEFEMRKDQVSNKFVLGPRNAPFLLPFFQAAYGYVNAAFSPSPYGVPGDRLWVRETFAVMTGAGRRVVYRATEPEPRQLYYPDEIIAVQWTPSIHMERWCSRITLEITDVRVERVQDISEADAKAEGVEAFSTVCPAFSAEQVVVEGGNVAGLPYKSSFACLWDEINGKRGFPWSSNPWVWALTFKRIE